MAAFAEAQRFRRLTEGHIKDQQHKLGSALGGVRTLAEVTCDVLKGWILRHGGAAQTQRHYVAAFHAFGLWLVRVKKAVVNPFAGLDSRGINPKASPTRIRDALTPAEAVRLLETVAVSPTVRLGMDGLSRALLYQFAMETGFRRNGIGSLVPESFDLAAPTVTLEAGAAKNRKRKVNAISSDLAAKLSRWFEGKQSGKILWPIKGTKTAAALAVDLALAGIPHQRNGRVLDFHALRVTCATLLFRKGASLPLVQDALGHSKPELTTNVYTRFWPADAGEFLNKKG